MDSCDLQCTRVDLVIEEIPREMEWTQHRYLAQLQASRLLPLLVQVLLVQVSIR